MDSVEKILNSLIDSMHNMMAKGHGDKKVVPKNELQKAADKMDVKVPLKSEIKDKEDDKDFSEGKALFEKFLKGTGKSTEKRAIISVFGETKKQKKMQK